MVSRPGRQRRIGMRFVSISGDVKRPGVYEVPFGQTVRELVFDTAGGMRDGQKLKADRHVRTVGRLPAGAAQAPNLLPEKFVKERLRPDADGVRPPRLAARPEHLGSWATCSGRPSWSTATAPTWSRRR